MNLVLLIIARVTIKVRRFPPSYVVKLNTNNSIGIWFRMPDEVTELYCLNLFSSLSQVLALLGLPIGYSASQQTYQKRKSEASPTYYRHRECFLSNHEESNVGANRRRAKATQARRNKEFESHAIEPSGSTIC